MSDTPWYKTFFGEDYLQIYDILTPERTTREVEGIANLLALPPGSAILDLCCGHGRHSIALAKRGYRVTGLDLSEVFLQHAQSDAEAQGVQVRWVHGDMRNIPFENEFDAVINIFTAFGYLENEDEDLLVLQQIQKALKPGGHFLLETKNREWLMRNFDTSEVIRYENGLIVLEERDFDLLTDRCNVKVTMIHPDGYRREYSHAAHMYTLRDYVHMLAAAGLPLQACFGGLDGSKLRLDSSRLVLISSRST
ncbi:MAG TPA: class I SAM-dependent methyltransferase [Ktedonobacteraceae bacterium]